MSRSGKKLQMCSCGLSQCPTTSKGLFKCGPTQPLQRHRPHSTNVEWEETMITSCSLRCLSSFKELRGRPSMKACWDYVPMTPDSAVLASLG